MLYPTELRAHAGTTYVFSTRRDRRWCYYRVSLVRSQLRDGPAKVLRLDGIVPPMHVLRLVPDNLHGSHCVHSCPPQIGTRCVPEIMKTEIGNSCPTAGLLKGGLHIPNRLFVVQEDTLSVQSPLLPQLREDLIHD